MRGMRGRKLSFKQGLALAAGVNASPLKTYKLKLLKLRRYAASALSSSHSQ
jgi:hypothetical protein